YPYAWEYRQRLPTRNSRAVDGRFGPARAVAFVLFHATNVHQSQAHLQGDQRPGTAMPAPDDPEQVACQEAPETDGPTAGPQRADQPCRDYRHHHRRPLQQVDPIHIASNEAGPCCPVKVGAVALRRVPKHPAGHGGRKTRVRFHATKPERICPPDATAWMAAASRPSFARLQQAHLLPWRRETAAIEPVVLIAAVEAQPLAGQPEALGKQVGELAFAAHAAAEAAVVILAATG